MTSASNRAAAQANTLLLPSYLKAVIFVAGPSASGKTTLVRRLADVGALYEERPAENSHLARFLAGGPLDAAANQRWFLDHISAFLNGAKAPIAIIDQSPLGVAVYAQMFAEQGLLAPAAAANVDLNARRILEALYGASVRTLHVVLTASSSTLWDRLTADQRPVFPRSVLSRLNELFQGVIYPAECLPMNSEVLTPDDEAMQVRQWIQRSFAA
jgi:deoxyadenosine/deoxycytidine kinase